MDQALKAVLEVGDLLDHYRVERVVARSGMSTLYRAVDERNGKLVALKVPHPEMEADPVLVERFRREEQIGLELDHPGIVKTYPSQGGQRMYMVIEWVDGQLLRAILNGERKLEVERATALTLGICDALDYMHKRGVVHRDLKPENIMVCEGDRIKLIDFGIAMKEDARRLTYAGTSPLLGTPDYISPEQVKGQRGDQRSDIYALGAMFYEMLTGQPPYVGPNPLAVMNERLLHDPESPRKQNKAISPQLEEILFRSLEREPRHRYATALEMAWELEHQDQVGVDESARKPSFHQRLPKGPKLALYLGMVLGPILLFALMLLLAKH
jgi:serine/threonine-protein kinase